MKKTLFVYVVLLMTTLACEPQKSQATTGDQDNAGPISSEQVLAAWDRMTAMVVGSTQKMPAEHFSFSPVDPLAAYGDLVSHTAGANYLFAATVKLERPERNDIDTSNKEAVIKNLEESFEFIRQGIQNLTNSELNEEIEWFGSKMSRLNAILTMTDHLQREYGKNITYLRLKGVEPARSAGW